MPNHTGTREIESGSAVYRQLVPSDAETVYSIRTATIENSVSLEQLAEHGYTPESFQREIVNAMRGWMCLVDVKPVGFILGDIATGEIISLAVLPGFEGRGIGSALLTLMEKTLFGNDLQKIWLWCSPETTVRSYWLYRKRGWIETPDFGMWGQRLIKKKGAAVAGSAILTVL